MLHGFHGERDLGSMSDVFDEGRATSANSELRTYGPVRWRDRTGVLSLTVIVNTFPDILAPVSQRRFSSLTSEYFPPFKSTLVPTNLPWAPVLPRHIYALAFVIGKYLYWAGDGFAVIFRRRFWFIPTAAGLKCARPAVSVKSRRFAGLSTFHAHMFEVTQSGF